MTDPTPFDEETRARFLRGSTATLTTLLFKRGLRNVFMQGVAPVNPASARFAAPAFTLRNIPAREDLDGIQVYQDYDHPQRKAIETVPAGHALVMDCRGDRAAACAGGILVTRLKVRGVAALVSDGGLRDTPEIAALGFPAHVGGSSPPTSLIRHHAVGDLDVPIGCGGVPVYPGDIVVGDEEGVVVVPRAIAAEVAAEAAEMERMEAFIQRKVANGAPLRGTYPPDDETRAEYKAWVEAGEPEE